MIVLRMVNFFGISLVFSSQSQTKMEGYDMAQLVDGLGMLLIIVVARLSGKRKFGAPSGFVVFKRSRYVWIRGFGFGRRVAFQSGVLRELMEWWWCFQVVRF